MEGAEHKTECEFVGEGMEDIAGIGILVGFVGQAAISLFLAGWAFLMSKRGDVDLHHEEGTVEHQIERKRLEFVSDILMIGNDIQMVLGGSYMITAFASAATLDLYHLRLVFDVVSFVGVSNAAAMVCWNFCTYRLQGSRARRCPTYFTARHRSSYLFAAMFLALTILLCVRLAAWAPDAKPGRCYDARLIAITDTDHPSTDIAYVAVTAAWMLSAMASAIFLGARRRRWVLVSAFLQFPVHLYMAVALRSVNQGLLEGDEGENAWDFGQTTAVVLLAVAVAELLSKGWRYFVFERELRTRGRARREGGAVEAQPQERGVEESRESCELQDEQRRSVTGESRKQVPVLVDGPDREQQQSTEPPGAV